MQLLRKIVRRGGAVLLGVVLAVILGEIAVRVLPFGFPPGIRASVSLHDLREVTHRDAKLGYALDPTLDHSPLATSGFEVFHASTQPVPHGPDPSIGFRDRFDDEPVWGVVVGDSFAMGWGVDDDDTFEAVTERQLGRRLLNLGVVGWGPNQELIALEEYGVPRQPEVVVWTFYPNDLSDAHIFEAWDGSFDLLSEKSSFNLLLNEHCALYKLYRYLGASRSRSAYPWSQGDVSYVFSHHWREAMDPTHPTVIRGLQLMKQVLDRVAELAVQHDFRVVFLAIPFREHVYFDEYSTNTDREPLPRQPLDATYREVLAYAESLGMQVLDTLPALERNKARQIFYRHDCHLTPLGNEIVARELTAVLR